MDVAAAQAPSTYDSFRADVRAFIAAHAPAQPDVRKAGMRTAESRVEIEELQQWLQALTDAGFAPQSLRGEDPWPRQIAIEELNAARAPYKIGNPLIDAAIEAHGTDEQRERFLPGLRSGHDIWCQLFSEPGAGSDLASLQTTARRDGDVYRVNGQKVWTTWGQWSDYGYLLARTDPDAGKHAGISAFAIDMHQPGVDVRPLREITGTSDFNEVFFTDAIVPVANRIGAEDQGWRIATTSLADERSGQGGLDDPLTEQILDLVRSVDTEDGAARDDLIRLYERAHIYALQEIRAESKYTHGRSEVGDAPALKLSFSNLNLDVAVTALDLLGTGGLLTEGDPRSTERGRWQDMFLYARAYTISGGSNEIMRNLIAERALGMPRDK